MSTLVDEVNESLRGTLPELMGMHFTQVDPDRVQAHMPVHGKLLAPNGYLHAGSLVTLADTCCGVGCRSQLPKGGVGFTTIELKSNHLATAREGTVECSAAPVHMGRTTQVWDAVVKHRDTGKTLVMFRCTQMILYPAPDKG
ncbi:PaaI family thioesterase [Diaphorobacter ruginosibacter]|uniref:PaaI family thioesterase n=1 Tax=Diaphorobacter ruginosibacter TaxID=1715720 RepID=UPI00333FF240